MPHYLKINPAGASDGDLVFVSGHPRTTGRLETYNMLMYRRDLTHPASIARQKAMRELLVAFSARGPEQARRARTRLYFVENSLKALEGEYEGLKDPALMERKRAEEAALIAKLEANPALSASRSAWSELDGAIAWARAHEKERLWKRSLGARGLLSAAIDIVRYAQEAPRPDADRLEGFHEAELADLLRALRNPGPTYKDLEEVLLAYELKSMAQGLGADDPFVRAVLAGATPEALAARAIEGTRLDDREVRRQLLENGGRGVAASRDPLIELARRVEPGLRETQNQFRDHVEAVEEKGLSAIAEARFAVYGTDSYPDASGTLRFSFGRISGYPFATTLVPSFTTFLGLLDRSIAFGNKGDFALPAGIASHQRELALTTPLNFVSTNDITGGNSGSPVVDRGGRLVGLVFDGNMQSHPNKFVYDEVSARSVSVDVRAILETLRKVYGAAALADELESAAK